MKLLLFVLLSASLSQARDADLKGNGGGVFVCKSPSGQTTSTLLVDLFEAQTQEGWTVRAYPPTMPPLEIAQLIATQNQQDLPTYASLWQSAFAEVQAKWHVVNADLEIVPDADTILRPPANSCVGGSWNYAQFANFSDTDHQLLVSQEYWNSTQLSNTEKAALIWHETIYLWLRNSYQDTNSVRARYITGLLFSTLSVDEKNKRLADELQVAPPSRTQSWFCVSKAALADKLYPSYAATEIDAKIQAMNLCQGGPIPAQCASNPLDCEQITATTNSWICTQDNFYNKLLTGRGRTQLEAKYHAQQACLDDPSSHALAFCIDDSNSKCQQEP